jgi:hypothetical protein
MSLWHKPTAEVVWQDVVDFCDVGYAEGVRVDYKRQMPGAGVAKHVAAFATSRGKGDWRRTRKSASFSAAPCGPRESPGPSASYAAATRA